MTKTFSFFALFDELIYGISLHPEILKLLEEQAKKENVCVSKLIQTVMIEHFKKQNNEI